MATVLRERRREVKPPATESPGLAASPCACAASLMSRDLSHLVCGCPARDAAWPGLALHRLDIQTQTAGQNLRLEPTSSSRLEMQRLALTPSTQNATQRRPLAKTHTHNHNNTAQNSRKVVRLLLFFIPGRARSSARCWLTAPRS